MNLPTIIICGILVIIIYIGIRSTKKELLQDVVDQVKQLKK